MGNDVDLISAGVVNHGLDKSSHLEHPFGVVYKLELVTKVSESPHRSIDLSFGIPLLQEILNRVPESIVSPLLTDDHIRGSVDKNHWCACDRGRVIFFTTEGSSEELSPVELIRIVILGGAQEIDEVVGQSTLIG